MQSDFKLVVPPDFNAELLGEMIRWSSNLAADDLRSVISVIMQPQFRFSKKFVRKFCKKFHPPVKKKMEVICCAAIVYMLKKCSPTYEEMSIQDLCAKYPMITKEISSSEELHLFLEYTNSIRMALRIIPAKNSKKLLMDVATLLEGTKTPYITGGGRQKAATRRRVEVYEQEGNVKPIPRKKKSRSAEVSTTHGDAAEEGRSLTLMGEKNALLHSVGDYDQSVSVIPRKPRLEQIAPVDDSHPNHSLIFQQRTSQGQSSTSAATMVNPLYSERDLDWDDFHVDYNLEFFYEVSTTHGDAALLHPVGDFHNNTINHSIPNTPSMNQDTVLDAPSSVQSPFYMDFNLDDDISFAARIEDSIRDIQSLGTKRNEQEDDVSTIPMYKKHRGAVLEQIAPVDDSHPNHSVIFQQLTSQGQPSTSAATMANPLYSERNLDDFPVDENLEVFDEGLLVFSM